VTEIAPATRMGPVELTVSDLARSLEYWEGAIGLRVLARENGTASLGAGSELVRLVEEPGARPADGHTGLYHVALLVPDRPSLARWLEHASHDRVPLVGLSDHYVSEAIYLRDPDHHGIEIYADRPRTLWEGHVFERMTTEPLDVDDLLSQVDDAFDELPPGTVVGHVHLRVAEIDETVRFYRNLVGFGLTAQLGPAAAFLSAGGYHHHLGANTWESRGAPPAPPGTAGLRRFTVVLPDTEELERVAERLGGVEARDPSGNHVVLAAEI